MKIKTIEMAEKILYRISEIDRDLTVAQNKTDGIIADAKNAYAEYSQSLEKEKTLMIEALHEFTDSKREEILRGNQSASLVNGIIGYRKGRATVECSADTADKLIAAGLAAFVKIEKKPAIAALINLPDTQLEAVDAKRIPGTETFYVKANTLRISDDKPAA